MAAGLGTDLCGLDAPADRAGPALGHLGVAVRAELGRGAHGPDAHAGRLLFPSRAPPAQAGTTAPTILVWRSSWIEERAGCSSARARPAHAVHAGAGANHDLRRPLPGRLPREAAAAAMGHFTTDRARARKRDQASRRTSTARIARARGIERFQDTDGRRSVRALSQKGKEAPMLQDAPMYAYIPARDLARARRFYEEKLGFEPKQVRAGGVLYEFARSTSCFLYPTPNAGTSKASQAFWQVDDIEREVAELTARGVQFERYDMPEMDQKGISTMGDAKAAWFKDTEGNIMAVIQAR